MWKIVGKPKTTRVTKQIATHFAQMEAVPNDRPLSERRLLLYRKILNSEGFRPVSWATCHCQETGSTYRVNGKHTSTMLSSVEELPEFYAIIEEYEAETLIDVAHLYSTFDSRTQSRSATDINRSFAASVPELSVLPSRVISLVVSAVAYTKFGDGYGKVPSAERAELMLDEVEFAVWLSGIIGSGGREKELALRRMAVASAMYVTWKKSHSAATTFWMAVRDETGSAPSCPDRRLAKFLSTNSVSCGTGAMSTTSRQAHPREFYAKCIYAWNSWRKSSTLELLKYHPQAKLPAPI